LLELYARGAVLGADAIKKSVPGYSNRLTPASDYLCDLMRPLMEDHLPQKCRYEECFDRFKYLLALVFADLHEKSLGTNSGDFRGPRGQFVWRVLDRTEDIAEVVANEVTKFSVNWAPLKNGLFDGSLDRLNSVKAGFDRLITKFRQSF